MTRHPPPHRCSNRRTRKTPVFLEAGHGAAGGVSARLGVRRLVGRAAERDGGGEGCGNDASQAPAASRRVEIDLPTDSRMGFPEGRSCLRIGRGSVVCGQGADGLFVCEKRMTLDVIKCVACRLEEDD